MTTVTRQEETIPSSKAISGDAAGWTTIDLSTMPANMTALAPGPNIASISIRIEGTSAGDVTVIYKDDPGAGTAANADTGQTVQKGATLIEDRVLTRYVSIRGKTGAWSGELCLRSYRGGSW